MRKIIVCIFVLMLCTSNTLAQEMKVGTLLPLTGASSDVGPDARKGVILAARQISEAGFEVELIDEDSQSSVSSSQEAAKKLVETDNVTAIVGAVTSGVTMAVAESVTGPNNILMISPGSTSPVLTELAADQDKDLLFRTCPSDAIQGIVLGELAATLYKTAAVMYVDNPYGQGLAEQFKKSFEKRGGRVLTMVAHPETAQSYLAELKKVLARITVPSGKGKKTFASIGPDVLCVFSYPEQAKIYLKEAIESFLYRSFLFCDGSKSVDLISTVGANNLEGMPGTAPGTAGGEPYLNFYLAFKQEFGDLPPTPFIPNSYDAMAVIGLAAYAAKAKGLPLTSQNIRDQVRSVANAPGETIKPGEFKKAFELLEQGKEINYEGATGSVDFDEHGDVVTPIEVWQYSQGGIITTRMEYYIPEE